MRLTTRAARTKRQIQNKMSRNFAEGRHRKERITGKGHKTTYYEHSRRKKSAIRMVFSGTTYKCHGIQTKARAFGIRPNRLAPPVFSSLVTSSRSTTDAHTHQRSHEDARPTTSFARTSDDENSNTFSTQSKCKGQKPKHIC